MSCRCVEQVNAALSGRNTQVERIFSLTGDGMLVGIRTVKVDSKKRAGPVALMATFCPFCGKRRGHKTEKARREAKQAVKKGRTKR